MKPLTLLYIPLGALCLAGSLGLCACHASGHGDEEHEHEAEGPADKGHAGEITLTAAQLAEGHIATERATAGEFHAVLRCGGSISRPTGGEQTIAATSAGIVTLSSALTEGAAISGGQRVATISAQRLEDGDPVAKARAAYDAAEYEMKRLGALAKDKIVSECDYDRARLAYQTAEATYNGLRRAATAAGVAISSPMAGFVKSVSVSTGDYVSVGQTIATVARDRRLTLRALVPESQAGSLAALSSANFRTTGSAVCRLADRHARLTGSGRSVAEGTGFIPATFEFDNTGNVLAGAAADVWLLLTPRQGVVSVPTEAITEQQGIYYIYIKVHADKDDTAFVRREVTLGADDGRRVEILSGLKPGEQYVARGAMLVRLASVSAAIPHHSHNH